MPKRIAALCVAFLPVLALAACGSSSKKTSSPSTTTGQSSPAATTGTGLHLTVSEAGKAAKLSGPASTPGGTVTVTLQNTGQNPHNIQFVRIIGNHTAAEAFKQLNSNSTTTPPWIRAAGGVSTTAPGQTNSGTVNLAAGKYLVTEVPSPGGGGPAPAQAPLTVSPGSSSALPSTPASVTAATAGKDRYHWDVKGLHAGQNQLTFKSEGAQALHLVAAVRIKPGQNPSEADILKSFKSNGPPTFADLQSYRATAVLDGGHSQVTSLELQPGTYVLFCPLTDRDGGKPHFAEGLLTKVTIK